MSTVRAEYGDADGHTHDGPPSRAEYVMGCRHPDCRQANTDYWRKRKRSIDRPDEAWGAKVPAGAARRHLAELVASGVPMPRIAEVSGVPKRTLWRILGTQTGTTPDGRTARRREVRTIAAATARRILNVGQRCAASADVDAGPTRALLDDLASEGYSLSRVAAMLGVERVAVGETVTARVAEEVAALHERLLGVTPIPGVDMAGVEPEVWWPPPPDAAWVSAAKCQPKRGRRDLTDLFFPGRGDDSSKARTICAGCLVRAECLAYAVEHRDIQGIWGAANTEERHRMRGTR